MEKTNFREIELGLIVPSKMNPRKTGSTGETLKALTDSIEKKGVIEPIIVRPRGKDRFEIVAGERRYKACQALQALDRNIKTIPAVVRDLGDDEAYDFMLIENLQREDLTALEEAESFKAYAARHGKDAIRDLAQKTAIDPRYIRARIEVLRLPRPALAAWEKGEISFGHLEQFLRLPGPTEVIRKLADVKRGQMSVARLRDDVSEQAIPLSLARFDPGRTCVKCKDNSLVQMQLFGIGEGKPTCASPRCFKNKQAQWFSAAWKQTDDGKRFKTWGACFEEDFDYGKTKHPFYGQREIAKKCYECGNFVSLVDLGGRVRNDYADGTVCVGDGRCFEASKKAAARVTEAKTKEEKKAAVAAAGRGPIPWHGAYFRNLFFRKRIPEVLAGLKPDDEKTKTLLAMCLARENIYAREAMAKAMGFKTDSVDEGKVFKALLRAPYPMVAEIFGAMVEAVVNEGKDAYQCCAFDTDNRQLAAEFLGVDIKKEWAVDEEYMRLKTRRELLAFGKTSGILREGKAKAYVLNVLKKKGPPDFARLKKSELVDVFMKSGIPLTGAVPAEVLK